MTRREELLRAVLLDPCRANCAVYGDHLIELGDPRGELIGLEVRMAEPVPLAERRQMLRRRSELLDAHGAGWWPGWSGQRRGYFHRLRLQTRFGFPTSWHYGREEVERAATRLEGEPFIYVGIGQPEPQTLPILLGAPWIRRIRHLWINSIRVPASFVTSPELCDLTRLAAGLAPDAIAALPAALPALRELAAHADADAVVDALLARPDRRLVTVELGRGLSAAGLQRFLAGGWPHLSKLAVHFSPVDDAGLFAIAAAAERLPALRVLELFQVGGSAAGARAIRTAPWHQKFRLKTDLRGLR